VTIIADALASEMSLQFTQTFSRHRRQKQSLEHAGSSQSRQGLDWMNFFTADVQTGFGAFVSLYLAELQWSQESVGFALTIGRISGVLGVIPAGALADSIRSKRGLAAAGLLMIGIAALILALYPTFSFVLIAEALHGLTAGILGPAIAAISLGLVGRKMMSLRVGRNHRYDAAGNALTAVAMGALGKYFTSKAIFLMAAALVIPALIGLGRIRGDEIDYNRARNAGRGEKGPTVKSMMELRKNSDLLWFASCLALFQLSDASMLPLVSERLGQSRLEFDSLLLSGLIAAPQLVVAFCSPWVGYCSELWGRKPLLVVGFGLEIIRGAIFSFISNSYLLTAVQILDGLSGAIISVLTIVTITDLTAGTGRFNLARGAVSMITGVAASVSTALSGLLWQRSNATTTFLSLAAVAVLATALLWYRMPETKPVQYAD
jgi:MFS family permease